MNNYNVSIRKSALKVIAELREPFRDAIVQRIERLADHPPAGQRLKGDRDGIWRVRVNGDGIVYELRDHEVEVLAIRLSDMSRIVGAGVGPSAWAWGQTNQTYEGFPDPP